MIALAQAKEKVKGIEKLEEHLIGMPALLFTKDNPFTLYKILKKNKSMAPAKSGQTALNDIVINAGPTSFTPGPIIAELGLVGLKTGVENGKVVIKEDKVVVKAGESIKPKVAELLGRLGIEPMEIGLNLVAAYEKGDILTHKVLDIDEDKYLADITQCAIWAFNLSIETTYLTKDNTELILQKAFMDAKALALEQNILADVVVEQLLGKAENQMNALKSKLNLPETPEKEEKKEEIKETQPEEKKEVEQKEEPKLEDKPAEEQKVEDKPAEEVKEEPKQEEQKAEEKAAEEKKEEKEEDKKQ